MGKEAARSWNPDDDKKLASLFKLGPKKGGVDPKKTDKDTIKLILNRHFGEFVYDNFAPLFRRKCAKWNTGKELEGARRGRKRSKL